MPYPVYGLLEICEDILLMMQVFLAEDPKIKISKYVNQNSSKQYYYLISSSLGNTTNANLTRLIKLQKRAARMILKADFMTSSEQVFKELNWLPFQIRVQYLSYLPIKALPDMHPYICFH